MQSEKNIARNLRVFRLAAGLKQKELARRLSVSPQTVSKWEQGSALPDLSNLCLLSDALSVPVDAFLQDAGQSGERLYLGIDGGGSKTEFALCDEDGAIIARLTREGCNPTVCGIGQTLKIIREGVIALGARTPDVKGVFAGVAGCPDHTRRTAISEELRRLFPRAAVDADADIVNVIWLSPHRRRCIAAICGTGSVAFAQTPGGLFRVGGWGPLFDTAGSGYDIGRDAVRAALAEEDGIGPRTVLTELVRARLGGCVFDAAAALPPAQPALIAAFAPLVFEAERSGDAVAAEILGHNIARLATLVNQTAALYDCGNKVVLAGGVTEETEVFSRYFAAHLNPSLSFSIMRDAPVVGALNRARELGKTRV